MPDASWPRGAYAAEFENEATFTSAVLSLREHGYTAIEAYSPYPVPLVNTAVPSTRSKLPLIIFAAGLGGGLLGYWIQWYANVVSYRLNIGGRPAHAVPAFFIPTFEATILCASLAAVLGLFALLRLPRPWHQMFEVDGFERASIDRFWIAIDARDPVADATATPRLLKQLRARKSVHIAGAES